jgi:hypothetical protein
MDAESGARAIIDWYAETGEKWLAPRAAGWAQRLGVDANEVSVRDLGLRWGLLDPERGPVLHWALFQLAPSIVDYVVVHELAHYVERTTAGASGPALSEPSPTIGTARTGSPMSAVPSGSEPSIRLAPRQE